MSRAVRAWVRIAVQLTAHPAVRRAGLAVARETGVIGTMILVLRLDPAAPIQAIALAFAGWRLTAIGRRWNKALAGAVREARHRP